MPFCLHFACRGLGSLRLTGTVPTELGALTSMSWMCVAGEMDGWCMHTLGLSEGFNMHPYILFFMWKLFHIVCKCKTIWLDFFRADAASLIPLSFCAPLSNACHYKRPRLTYPSPFSWFDWPAKPPAVCRDLFTNKLTGTLPTELGALTRLTEMYDGGETPSIHGFKRRVGMKRDHCMHVVTFPCAQM